MLKGREMYEKNLYGFGRIAFVSVLTGYTFGRSFAEIVPKNENKIYAAQKSEVYEADADKNKITPSTKLVYEYYYPITGEKETKEETAPYFMVDLTFDDLQKYYSDWQVTYFSADKVVMQKKVYDEKGQKYIIGEKDGKLTVFWETDKDGEIIKEVTDIYVSSLPAEEQEKIRKGIEVIGEESLINILQDYGS